MKKRLLLLAIVLVVAFTCLTACNLADQKQLNVINQQLRMNYSTITVNVTTTTADNITLEGEFTLTFNGGTTTIAFEYEQLSTFDGDSIPDDFKTTVSGTATVADGKVVVDGDEVDLPLSELTVTGYSFKQAFFTNVTQTNYKFDADVENVQGFTGNRNMQCSNMHVYVVYNTSIRQMRLNYTSLSGASTEIEYTFEI